MSGLVIIGAGQAGGRAALSLRKFGFTGSVTLIGSEPHPPYERPPLSKSVLTAGANPSGAVLATREAFFESSIDLRTKVEATSIDRARRSVILSSGGRIAYETLILATGARPRDAQLPGANHRGVVTLRSAADALALRRRLLPGCRLVVVGGGFIGLEVAASVRALGCSVTVVEAAERLLQRSVPTIVAEAVRARHRAEGVEILTGVSTHAIETTATALSVRLDNGETLPADTVLIAAGAVPETRLAKAAGLDVDDGILADGAFRTSDPNIRAIGDCARAIVPRYGAALRFESYQNADQQAEACARVLTGAEVAHDPVPWLWSDQYDWTLHTTGLFGVEDVLVERPVDEAGAILILGLRNGRLTAAAGFGPLAKISQPVRLIQMMIEQDKVADREQLADPAIPLKRLLKAA
ncbi:NAD(P)/FAD-dependent oxidoreductase [Hoeflea sp. TYP-13]|uniref:NAD(P)/FAD-dependent oxidoreductase n=1 Tax=Hoeflea sp. TYP-13 TaxID=3230023 RepID=UPI0034C618DA